MNTNNIAENPMYLLPMRVRRTYLYDENSNLYSEVLSANGRTYGLGYGHDGRDSLASMSYPGGLSLSYEPNAFGQPRQIYWPPGINQTTPRAKFAGSIEYYANGQLKSYNQGGASTTLGQDARLLPTTIEASSLDETIVDIEYDHDAVGNVRTITDHRDPARSRTLTYDGVNRLRTAAGPFGVGGVSVSGQFTYDDANNIRSKVLSPQNLTYNYSQAGRLESITGTLPMSFTYDGFGNIISNGRNLQGYGVFSYDGGSNLVRVGSPAKLNYTYDGNQRLTVESRTDGTSTRYSVYALSGKRYFEEDIVNFEATAYIYLGNELLASRSTCTATTDADADGIPSCIEWRLGTNPSNPADAALDLDSDGLTGLQEFQAGTNILHADTDGDTIPDGYEVNHGLNPVEDDSLADLDADGLTNLQEYQLGTLPDDNDTDNDGVLDGVDPAPKFNPALLVPILDLILE